MLDGDGLFVLWYFPCGVKKTSSCSLNKHGCLQASSYVD